MILFIYCLCIQSVPNPVYLFQGIVLRRGAKGTGMKSIELALSMCDIVDIYGFTVDPGYTEWYRFSSSLCFSSWVVLFLVFESMCNVLVTTSTFLVAITLGLLLEFLSMRWFENKHTRRW